METKIKRLVMTFKALRKRNNRAINGFNKLASKLYVPLGSKMVNVKRMFLADDGYRHVSGYGTVFYRRDCGGKFYVKDYPCDKRQPCTWCDFCDGSSCEYDGHEKVICADYAALSQAEEIIDMLGDELENLLVELDKLGVDPYDDLWR